MASETHGSILLSTADSVSRMLMKKLDSETGFKPSEWTDNINLLGALPIRTASGTIAHFEDGADDVPMKSVVAQIVPIQSGTGTPSPSNPRPISGTSVLNVEQRGKNRVNLVGTEIASNYDPADPVPFEDGYIIKGKTGNSGYIRPSTTSFSITGDSITVQASLAHYGVGFVIKVEPTQTITVSLASGSKYGVNFYDSAKKYMSSLSYYTEEHTFTIPSGAYWLIVVLVPNNLNTDETFVKVQAEFGSTPTTYEPYQSAEYPVPLGQTVYGGSAEVVEGTGTDAYIKHEFSSSEIISDNYIVLNSSTNVWYWTQNNLVDISGIDNDATHYCNVLKQDNNAYNGGVANAFRIISGNRFYITLSADNYPTKEDFRNAIDTLKPVVVLKKTTPTDFTFEGEEINSYLGVNNLYVDSGEVLDVEYRADMNLLIAELEG